jgi:hypothetical protein
MDVYSQIVEKIIIAQEGIIGPIALEQAGKVPGLQVDLSKHDIRFEGQQKEILGKLVEQYRNLFGQASVEMCKDAIKGIASEMKADELPVSLK